MFSLSMGRQWRIWTILKNAYVQQFLLYKILSRLCYEAACERSNLGVYILLLALTNFMVYISAKESNNIQIIFNIYIFKLTFTEVCLSFFWFFKFYHLHDITWPSEIFCRQSSSMSSLKYIDDACTPASQSQYYK